METNAKSNLALTLRWAARISASLTALFLFLMFVGQILGGDRHSSGLHFSFTDIFASALWLIYFVSLLAGWKWEFTSGVCMVIVMVIKITLLSTFSGWIFPLMMVPGILFMASSRLNKHLPDPLLVPNS